MTDRKDEESPGRLHITRMFMSRSLLYIAINYTFTHLFRPPNTSSHHQGYKYVYQQRLRRYLLLGLGDWGQGQLSLAFLKSISKPALYTSSVKRLLRSSGTELVGVSLLGYPPPCCPCQPPINGLPTPELGAAGLKGMAGVLGTVLDGLAIV